MKKKIIILLTIFYLFIVLCSCGGGKNSNDISDEYIPKELTAQNGEAAEGFTWVNDYSEIAINGYIGDKNEIIIPSKINGKPVTKIIDEAFSNFSSMTLLVVPEYIKNVGNNAFANCTSLEKVIWYPAECQSAGTSSNSAFKQCTGLKSVEFKDTATLIPSYIFQGCRSLKTVTGCQNVERIGASAFAETGIVSYPFNERLSYVGANAFAKCKNLIEVIWDSSECEYVGTKTSPAFDGCDNLKSVVFKDSVNIIPSYIFNGCVSLKTVTGCQNVKSIGDWAFTNSGITSFPFNNNLTSIGEASFFGCIELSELKLPSSVTEIQTTSFAGASAKLKSIIVEEGNPKYKSVGNCLVSISDKALLLGCESSVIPDDGSVETICSFIGVQALKKLTIPEGVKNIFSNCFFECTGLESISLPKTLTTIGVGAFKNCSSLKSIVIPEKITEIPQEAFSGCSHLSNVTLNHVATIGNSAFEGCYSLDKVVFPKELTKIGLGAFKGASLFSVVFNDTNHSWFVYNEKDLPVFMFSSSDLSRGFGYMKAGNSYDTLYITDFLNKQFEMRRM